jgi:hypothetical protein
LSLDAGRRSFIKRHHPARPNLFGTVEELLQQPSAAASAADAYTPDFRSWLKARVGTGGNSTVTVRASSQAAKGASAGTRGTRCESRRKLAVAGNALSS